MKFTSTKTNESKFFMIKSFSAKLKSIKSMALGHTRHILVLEHIIGSIFMFFFYKIIK